ncbi:hypothetical protein N7468_006829 [Penicillium chermesinum]|uniref:Dynamin family protein n=1 Tax=Penicillium chermesinum TaxID=63820 RepID=A0A9W9TK70_9EURO|nr:uncharacterized protein N7468_006829 [Penicillium chermesinum]KAJ5225604.1 hypothetical protein N7468_006829 [Penicillium chermesinum]
MANIALPNSTTETLKRLDIETLVKKVQNLSHLGIEDNNITLPKICVVGDQSTGKSSLIESISGIKVPRSTGTCTRCPMEINLSESDEDEEWKCSIYLSTRYWYLPTMRARQRFPRKGLGPWTDCGSRQPDDLFVTLTARDKHKVQDAIKWAQLATLNPGSDFNNYKPGKNADTTTAVKFSPNVVRIDVSSPNFPALSFYDLPGVINQSEQDDEKYLVPLVENLVKSYVSQENCIVLLTLTMTDDPTNSSAARLVGEVKGAKERTLGVLTKPDKLDGRESYQQWEDILNGSKFKLGRGYYVVRNNPDPSVSNDQAREEEVRFFSTSLWVNSLKAYQGRFGVPNVVQALSTILKAQIQTCLPSIINQIDEKARRIDEELATFPAPLANNVQGTLIKKIIQLGMRIKNLFGSDPDTNVFRRTQKELELDFETILRITRPRLKTSAVSDEHILKERVDADCELMFASTPRKKRAGTFDSEATVRSPTVVKADKSDDGDKYFKTRAFSSHVASGHIFSLEHVREIRLDSQSGGIPNHVDTRAADFMARLSIQHWSNVAHVFVTALHDHVEEVLTAALDDELSQYKQTELYREVQTLIQQFMYDVRTEQLCDIMKFFNIQYEQPFTIEEGEHEAKAGEALKSLQKSRTDARIKCWLRLSGQPADEQSAVKSINETKLGRDPFHHEINMVAKCRGYYEIARGRFLDVVCQMVRYTIHSKFRDELDKKLLRDFTDQPPERCAQLMAEDPQREALRYSLIEQREKLHKAQGWLAAIRGEENEQFDDIEDLMVKSEMVIDVDTDTRMDEWNDDEDSIFVQG